MTGKLKRGLLVSGLSLLLLTLVSSATATLAARPAVSTAGSNCVPGTQPLLGMFRAYLPMILGSGANSVPACVTEVEINDTHTAAQVITSHCVWGNAASSGDPDWYALGICSPVTLTVRMTGQAGADLSLYLHGNPPGIPIASSEELGPNQVVSAHLITGVYYSLVQPAMGSGAYTLTFEVAR